MNKWECKGQERAVNVGHKSQRKWQDKGSGGGCWKEYVAERGRNLRVQLGYGEFSIPDIHGTCQVI